MSSYLDRLGARHTDAPAIRPRAVSRFERVAASAPLADDAAPGDEAREVTARDATSDLSVNNATRHGPQSRGMLRSDETRAHADAWHTGVVTASPPAEVIDPDARERLDTVRPRAEPADRAFASTPSATISPAPVATELRLSSASPVRGTLSATPIVPRPSMDARVDGAAVAPRSRTQMPTDVGDALAQIGAPVVREPDVIRVHIGRVEVRAILPAARPTPRQSTSAGDSRPMSLDRYLGGKDHT